MAEVWLESLRQEVIDIACRAQREKLMPLTLGNFSLRDRETGHILITPSGMEYGSLVPSDIVVVDLKEKIIDGQRKPSVETPLHCEIYRRRPDVGGIVHTHSTFATAWACCGIGIPPVVAEVANRIGGEVPCAPYRQMGSRDLAAVTGETLGIGQAVLLANHGMLAVGKDLTAAFVNAVIVEDGAKIAYYAKEIGQLQLIPADECRQLQQFADEKYGQTGCPKRE